MQSLRGELIVAWSRVVQVRNCSDFGCFEDRAYGICQCIGYGVYKTVRNVRPQGFWIEEISRFTGVKKQEELVWGGSIEGIVLSSLILDMLSLRDLLEV